LYCFGGQISEEQPGIGAVRKADAAARGEPKGVATVDSREPVARRPAMGESGEDQEAWHEAESTGRQGVYGLEREEVLCGTHGRHQRQHLTAEK
jgi:hypothetical protein